MIGQIRGILLNKAPPQVLLEAGGVGYEMDLPMNSFYALPAPGSEVTLLTHLVVREDAHILYGFATAAERIWFRQLIRISGIGPKTALSLLSGVSVADLQAAIAAQAPALLTKIPGIGKKTAERLLLELKDKALAPAGQTTASGNTADIAQALITLGYSEREALAALRQLPADISVDAGIKEALKALLR